MLKKYVLSLIASALLAGCGISTPDTIPEKRYAVGVAYDSALTVALTTIKACEGKPCGALKGDIQQAVRETDAAHEALKKALTGTDGEVYVNLAIAGLEVSINKLQQKIAEARAGE